MPSKLNGSVRSIIFRWNRMKMYLILLLTAKTIPPCFNIPLEWYIEGTHRNKKHEQLNS